MPKQFKNPLLVFIEGDVPRRKVWKKTMCCAACVATFVIVVVAATKATAPHKNFVEQQRLIECHLIQPPAPARQAGIKVAVGSLAEHFSEQSWPLSAIPFYFMYLSCL